MRSETRSTGGPDPDRDRAFVVSGHVSAHMSGHTSGPANDARSDATLAGVGSEHGTDDGRGLAAAPETVLPLLRMTRLLVGIATEAVEELDVGVSLPQFRLLLVLSELGPTPSARVADRLGTAPSSVTRLADHLERAGYVVRRRERPNRSVVRLELTATGSEIVDRVGRRRAAELDRLLTALPPHEQTQLAELVTRFCDRAELDRGDHGSVL